jgi:hypothetical protein
MVHLHNRLKIIFLLKGRQLLTSGALLLMSTGVFISYSRKATPKLRVQLLKLLPYIYNNIGWCLCVTIGSCVYILTC